MRYFSTFSGIGGFELGIQLAYEKLCITDKEHGLQGTGDTQGQQRKLSNVCTDGLTCIGFSEIDKYATSIYQKHFPYEQCTFCKEKEERTGQEIAEGLRIRKEANDNEGNEGLGSSGAEPQQHNLDSTDRQFNNCECKHKPYGDITTINTDELPDFDLLVGGFPCQSFSIAGKRRGFEDTRGTMFFELARILRAKQPRLFVFENVKGLLSHDNGQTFRTIIATLDELRYDLQWQVLNSKNHGVPQNRERIFIIGHLRGTPQPQVFPFGQDGGETDESCERQGGGGEIAQTITATYWKGAKGSHVQQLNKPTHSNDRVYGADGISPTLNTMQGGNRQPFISLEEMKIRRLTPTECERLQGFPDGWTEGVSDTQRYKTLGNAVTVNVIHTIMSKLLT